MRNQEQFLDVIDRDEAERRFHAALKLVPAGTERIPLNAALGRVLAGCVKARIDVPAFDRSNVDGYAVRALETFGSTETDPRRLTLLPESIEAGCQPSCEVAEGQCVAISTGGMIPRGADAVLMVEHTDQTGNTVVVRRPVTPGGNVAFAGTDVAMGETVLRPGQLLTSRETGVLAALGETDVEVFACPRVAIFSTGNEIVAPGKPLRPAGVYDSNSQILADAVRELGGIPVFGGIIRDDAEQLRTALSKALQDSHLVILSGGTSKGQGDLCYRVVAELTNPGVLVHGVALKPGKPVCLAVTNGLPVVVLPGFPTSAVFTFHEFVAPVLRALGGRRSEPSERVTASMAVRVNSEPGRTEFVLTGLVRTEQGFSAYPMGRGSGSVTAFSRADGFLTIPRHTEFIEANQQVEIQLLGRGLQIPDLVVIGSHCAGLDALLTVLQTRGMTSRFMAVGSSAGLEAARRGECDLAGIHLLDPQTGQYNQPFLSESLALVRGYQRSQGIAFRPDDARFIGQTAEDLWQHIAADPSLVMINRNQGSGTRILIDRFLRGLRPQGCAVQPVNHSAVGAAIVQGRADWGVTIEAVARASQLAFVPLQAECFDFAIPKTRLQRPAVQAFLRLLQEPSMIEHLHSLYLECGIPGITP